MLIQARFLLQSSTSSHLQTFRQYQSESHPIADYKPSWYLPSGHLQTIFTSIIGDGPPMDFDRQILPLPDGGTIALDWHPSRHLLQDYSELVIILHGLAGGSNARYVKDLITATTSRHTIPFVIVNARGCGNLNITSPRLYHAGATEDIKYTLNHIHEHWANFEKIIAVGFSLGANQLVKFMGETGKDCPLHAAVAVSCPFDLVACSENLHSSFIGRHLYSRVFAHNLSTLVLRNLPQLRHHPLFQDYNWPHHLSRITTVYDFDDQITARAFGFKGGAMEYYKTQSCKNWIADVKRPLLCLNDLDDPIEPPRAIPLDDISANKYISLLLTHNGGHIGWFDGGAAPERTWYNVTLADHIVAMSKVKVVDD